MQQLLRCPNCGRIYRISKTKLDNENLILVTDLGGQFIVNNNSTQCMNCQSKFKIRNTNLIISEEWIIDKLFTVKG